MKVININNLLHLPLLNKKILPKNEKTTNKSTINEIKNNRLKRLNFSPELNNITNNIRKKNSLKIFSPVKKRFFLNKLNNFNSNKNFNSFDLSDNQNNKKLIFSRNNFEIPFKTKRRINILSFYNINNININNTPHLKIKLKLKENKSDINLIKSKLIEDYFINYSYNENQNILHRKSMEDFHCIKTNLLNDYNNNITYSYFAIFDGHSGKEVSLYLSQNFHKILSTQLKTLKNVNISKIISVIKNTFLLIDKEILKDPSFKKDIGSTGTILLLFNLDTKYIISANIGDSKGYIISNQKLIKITKDHNCFDENEVSRIKTKGGIVFNKRVYGTLILTRSFGDKEMKKYGVISEPYIFCKKICEKDEFIVIASDGLWDAIDEKNILDKKYWGKSTNDFSKNIVKLAIDKGTVDNVSCIVIKLNEVKKENEFVK